MQPRRSTTRTTTRPAGAAYIRDTLAPVGLFPWILRSTRLLAFADELEVRALGADSGISRSEVSRICGELDEELTALKERPLDHTVFPHVFLEATYCKARVNHRIVSQAPVIATGISAVGHSGVL